NRLQETQIRSEFVPERNERTDVFGETCTAVSSVPVACDGEMTLSDSRVRTRHLAHLIVIDAERLAEIVHLLGEHHLHCKERVPKVLHGLRFRGCRLHGDGCLRKDSQHEIGDTFALRRRADDLTIWLAHVLVCRLLTEEF